MRRAICLFAMCLVPAVRVALADEAVRPGASLPRDVAEPAKVFMDQGRRALAAMDEAGVRASCSNAIAALGPWAGNPETETKYVMPKQRGAFDADKLRKAWLDQLGSARRKVVWAANPEGDPRKMEAGLRAAAHPLDAIARSVALFPEHKTELLALVRAGADWLLKLQNTNGVFPMPVGPSLEPKDKVGHIMERMLKQRPEWLVDGWIVDFPEDGGLQFDNGLCGAALVTAWDVTHDGRYLESAKRAADWAVRQPLVPNWNYNAFSVGLLARVAKASGEAKYLEAAVTKARIGVLPGQMANGRWFDAHNASAVYHNILLRDLLTLFDALPAEHPFRATVRDALVRGLDNAAAETSAKGFTGTWTAGFARSLALLGENAAWREALNISVQSAFETGTAWLGLDVVAVLELVSQSSRTK